MNQATTGAGAKRSRTAVPEANRHEAFVGLLTAEQMRLLYYLTMLLGDPHAAENVRQETNVVLWRKSGEFQPGTDFTAWSRKVAYWQAQAYFRDRGRDRHVFSDELIEELASCDHGYEVEPAARLALRDCLSRVHGVKLETLRRRYEDGLPIAEVARLVGRTETAVRSSLMRMRRTLRECIEGKLGKSASTRLNPEPLGSGCRSLR